jgi:hypothetical protein
MKRTLPLLAMLASCTDAPNESIGVAAVVGEIEIDEDCPSTGCGANAGFVGGVYFADLNFNGIPNDQGVVQSGFSTLPVGAVRLDVQTNRLVAMGPGVPGAKVAEGQALKNSQLTVIVDGVGYPVTIAAVHRYGEYWAKKNGVADPTVESYRFQYIHVDPMANPPTSVKDLCVSEPSLVGDQREFDAVVFENERYDAETKNIELPKEQGWFNIACLSGAVGKTHMMRRTSASSSVLLGYTTSMRERQAMVRAWTADYCGHGTAYTTTGTPLRMRDAKKWIPLASKWSWDDEDELVSYEAIWNENGAVCLNTPRKFGDDEEANKAFRARIEDECKEYGKVLLPCSTGGLPAAWETRGYFLTANPAP